MAPFLPIPLPFFQEEKLQKAGPERLPLTVDAGREDRRPSARNARTWFPTVPAYSDDMDVDDDEDDDGWCCCEPLNSTERILGWLTCFLGGLILSAASLGASPFSVSYLRPAFVFSLRGAYICSNCRRIPMRLRRFVATPVSTGHERISVVRPLFC